MNTYWITCFETSGGHQVVQYHTTTLLTGKLTVRKLPVLLYNWSYSQLGLL
jgi:hypothetical protein